jgi:hypothetical protein
VTAAELTARFELERVPKKQVVFTPADDAWLLDSVRGRDLPTAPE